MQTPILHFFRHNKKGATLIELMAMLLVVSLALTTFFYTLMQTMNFSQDTEARIKAVSLAREWIEAVTNIRNTNWLRFSSSRKNCWNVQKYNSTCITNNPSVLKIDTGNYFLTNKNGAWNVEKINDAENTIPFASKTQLYIDSNGWYVGGDSFSSSSKPQNRCKNIATNSNTSTNCVSLFSRVIKVTKTSTDNMTVQSIVTWRNMFWSRKVQIDSEITNWKALYD